MEANTDSDGLRQRNSTKKDINVLLVYPNVRLVKYMHVLERKRLANRTTANNIGPFHQVQCLVPEHVLEFTAHEKMFFHRLESVCVRRFASSIDYFDIILHCLFKFLTCVHVDPSIKLWRTLHTVTKQFSVSTINDGCDMELYISCRIFLTYLRALPEA